MNENSKNVIFIATVSAHILAFHTPYLKYFQEQGYKVHVAASSAMGGSDIPYCDYFHDISFARSPFSTDNLIAYKQLKAVFKDNFYDLVHCHTPMGGVLARLIGKKYQKMGTKIIYTAHGFHFFKGAPLLNWLIYYSVEKWLSRYTDALITINTEDYDRAKRKLHAKQTYYVHGVGYDDDKFKAISPEAKAAMRSKLLDPLGIDPKSKILICVGELNKNKNQALLINSLNILTNNGATTSENDPVLLLVGDGPMKTELETLVNDNTYFLGQRCDVTSLLAISDVAVAASLREGLPVSILEAMASGLPIVASDIRGHRDEVKESTNGYLIAGQDANAFAAKLKLILEDKMLYEEMSKASQDLAKPFAKAAVLVEMTEIYDA